ncbi:DNA adenine methylase [Nitrosovibrio sp. Nv4]|nr:DNA adenine methylase [Nitrosovibrio sp. Nv4]
MPLVTKGDAHSSPPRTRRAKSSITERLTKMHNPIIPWVGGKTQPCKQDHAAFPFPRMLCRTVCGSGRAVLPEGAGTGRNAQRHQWRVGEFIPSGQASYGRACQAIQVGVNQQTNLQVAAGHTRGKADRYQRAAKFYYLQKLAFGGRVEGQTFGTATTSPPKLNLLRLEEDFSQAHLRLARTYIEHLDWRECINKYDRPHTLFYCDPPYWGTEGYGVGFGLEQYDEMAKLAKTIKGYMIISVNDIPEMRDAFAGLTMESVDINYTVGGAQRCGKRAELIIRNW